ncbi:hypothetical protein C9374_004551 [Naegleria lovaniensis]|uniref:Signal peptidase complex subunit 1 n=1 Tax=Naegleria lovaniensis TaxID=51637 RepID=A0AA88GQB6_NAELO|nr:uncharacterized protein C9374_004551 [Naegleria lovaniensis]KAG2383214.1 hypothetical protein C9374_004551 [Naegleria lovaniensis]
MSAVIDYRGQALAESIYRYTLFTSAIVGLLVGFYFQKFSFGFYIFAIGTLLVLVLTVPPWPFYRRNPVVWRTDIPNDSSEEEEQSKKVKSY